MYGEGVSKEGGLLDVGVAMSIVNKTGAWFTFEETRLGQGREASKDFLKRTRTSRRRSTAGSAARSTRSSCRSRASKRPSSAWRLRGPREPRLSGRPGGRRSDDPEVVTWMAAARFLEASAADPWSMSGGGLPGRAIDRSSRGQRSPRLGPSSGCSTDAEFARPVGRGRGDRAHPRGEHALIIELRQKGGSTRRDRGDAQGAGVRPRSAGKDRATLAPGRGAGALRRSPQDPEGWPPGAPRVEGLARSKRVADPRLRRQKAYALLARSGFAPDVCREASIEFMTRAVRQPTTTNRGRLITSARRTTPHRGRPRRDSPTPGRRAKASR
jgi:hypothetical protein